MDLERHCHRAGCICTHTEPCYGGWVWIQYVEEVKRMVKGIPSVTLVDREGVRPCMICDPERYEIWLTSKSSHEYHERLSARSSHQKIKAYEKDERDKTRTL